MFVVGVRRLGGGLGRKLEFFLFVVVERGSGESNVEVARGEVIGARIKLVALERLVQAFDRIGSERLDGEQRARHGPVNFPAILVQQRHRFFDAHDAGDTRTAFAASAEGGKADHLAGAVEKRTAGITGIDVDVGNDRVLLDLADDAGGDDLIESERAADGEDALAFLDRWLACRWAGKRRWRGVWQCRQVYGQQRNVFLRVSGAQAGRA